jgi:hypothetical protein
MALRSNRAGTGEAAGRRLIWALSKAAAPNRAMMKNTARQPKRSATRPAKAAPSRLPPMVIANQRAIATCRSATGTASPMMAKPTGKIPPVAMPQMIRASSSSEKAVGQRAGEGNDDDHHQAHHHQADFADQVGERCQNELHAGEGQRKRRRGEGHARALDSQIEGISGARHALKGRWQSQSS